MAARDVRGRDSGEAEEADKAVAKSRAVDPAPVSEVSSNESRPELVTVTAVSSGVVEAPSGATFALSPGTPLKVMSSDVDFLVSQGHVTTES